MRTIKIKIHHNNKQATKIKQTMNKCIEAQNIIFTMCKYYLDNNLKLPSCSSIRKEFTKIKKEKDLETINKRIGLTKKEQREPELLPHFSVHNLRHTFCTRFCENETNLKIIQEIMGHADISTTMNIYNEATKEKKIESFANLEGKIKIS